MSATAQADLARASKADVVVKAAQNTPSLSGRTEQSADKPSEALTKLFRSQSNKKTHPESITLSG